MKQHQLKIFKVSTPTLLNNKEPLYLIQEGKFFRTVFHPNGHSEQPDYDLGNDGRIYRTENHPQGFGRLPDYEFGSDRKLYRTPNHPDGEKKTPEYEIAD